MSVDISYFKTIQNASGCKNQKEQKVAYVRNRFAKDFDSMFGVVHDAERNGVDQDFVIATTKEKNKCAIFTRPNELLNIGDIIFWNGLHWLVIDKDFQDTVYNSGTIVRCNRTIKWQNQRTGEIIERWCLCTKPYTSNVDNGNIVSVSNREYKIQIPYDSETELIDLGKRFYLEVINGKPKSYAVTSVDTLTNRYQDIGNNSGFIVWNLTQDQAGEDDDNSELMICNYINPSEIISKRGHIEVSGNPDLMVGGASHSYVVKFYKNDGILDSTVVSEWTVTPPSCGGIHYNNDGNVLVIYADDSTSLIGESVLMSVRDVNHVYEPYVFTVNCMVI